jgi:hypothetical protein
MMEEPVMRALIVYESMFGNNRTVAQAVARGLTPAAVVEVVEVGAAPPSLPADLDLLVVGGPNHAFGMSRPNTREQAAKETDEPLVSSGIGLREWLDGLPHVERQVPFAAFDSRVDKKAIRVVDRTAGMIAKRLRKHGLRPLTEAESFLVEDLTGPLVAGEAERARLWGRELATLLEPTPVG